MGFSDADLFGPGLSRMRSQANQAQTGKENSDRPDSPGNKGSFFHAEKTFIKTLNQQLIIICQVRLEKMQAVVNKIKYPGNGFF